MRHRVMRLDERNTYMRCYLLVRSIANCSTRFAAFRSTKPCALNGLHRGNVDSVYRTSIDCTEHIGQARRCLDEVQALMDQSQSLVERGIDKGEIFLKHNAPERC